MASTDVTASVARTAGVRKPKRCVHFDFGANPIEVHGANQTAVPGVECPGAALTSSVAVGGDVAYIAESRRG